MDITYTDTITVEDYNMLREAVHWGSCKPDRVLMALSRSDFITVAQLNGQTIGMARAIQDGLQALIMDVIVLPGYQGNGIGKSMMSQIMAYLGELSKGEALFVNLMSALGKEGFYEKFGFERRPNENRGSGMTQTIVKEDTPQ